MFDDQTVSTGDGESSGKRQTLLKRGLIFGGAALAALVFVALMAGGISFLHIRANAEKAADAHPPITVETTPFKLMPGYTENSHYVGRLEAGRRTALAFERGGLIVEVAKDEGQSVQLQETVASLDVALLQASRRQLLAQIRELQARRTLAKLTLERQEKLRTKGWSPDVRFDEAQASVAELTAAIERVEAQIGSIDIDLHKSVLRAPFDGVVAERSIDEGAIVAAGTPVLTLLETRQRQVRVGLPPEQAGELDPAREYKLRSGDRLLSGTLAAKRPDLAPGTRTATALFDVTGAEDLPFGEIVTLEFDTEIHEQGGWLPLSALKEGNRGLWIVMTAEEKGGETLVRNESVEILSARDQTVFVRGTLQDGALVITNGGNRVIDGQRIALARE
jgi:RND family efflux transporter MFP subunit